MKVYVATKANPFQEERYLFVKASKKEAEKELRMMSPYMRPTEPIRKDVNTYFADAGKTMLYFIHEEII